jgi:hypothetical protein
VRFSARAPRLDARGAKAFSNPNIGRPAPPLVQ